MKSFLTLLLGLLVVITNTAWADDRSKVPESMPTAEDSIFTRSQLTGDWWGARKDLEDHGLAFDLSYTGFYQGQFSGAGDKDFEYGDRFDALINLDTGKLGLWQGGSFHTHFEYNGAGARAIRGGADLAVNIGQGLPSGAPEKLVASSLYYRHAFSDRTSMMIGKINTVDLLASDPFYGGWGNTRFMNLGLVAPPTTLTPPVIIGGIFNHKIDPITWSFWVFDPNDQTDEYSLDGLFSDGVSISFSGTWSGKWAGRASSLNMQAVYSTKERPDQRDSLLPPNLQRTKDDSWHFGIKATHLLLESPTDPDKGLGVYGKAVVFDGNPNRIKAYFSGGLAGHNMVPGRPDDVFGIGYYYYNFRDDLQKAVSPVSNFDTEQGVEAFYNFAVTPWFNISADIQWIDPANGDNDSTWLGALRVGVTF